MFFKEIIEYQEGGDRIIYSNLFFTFHLISNIDERNLIISLRIPLNYSETVFSIGNLSG